ncbi:hypothetical protein ACI5KX_12575 [Erythrobacter sp. GH1-10]|uniref:hypothetical protein n=1 Tax=Erythrobacter sp. GH1-10 TaxID=3349334 RepID=UPI00387790BA
MRAINQEYFDRPETLQMARGKQLGRLTHFPDGDRYSNNGGRNGGMRAPKPRLIAPSTLLVRFGGSPYRDARPFAAKVASGEWWLDDFRFKVLEAWANARGESITYAVRQLCAVPDEWSDMSYVVKARTRSPLMAYTGYGRPATAGKTRIDPRHDHRVDIEQLFIPGLASPDLRKAAIIVYEDRFIDPGMSGKGARREAETEAAMRARLKAAANR